MGVTKLAEDLSFLSGAFRLIVTINLDLYAF